MSAMEFSGSTTVDEVIHANPALGRVFAAHGIDTCCGGAATLAEAASSRGIALDGLLQALGGHHFSPIQRSEGTGSGHPPPSARGGAAASVATGPGVTLIRPDMTVRDVLAAYPATAAVFERYGLMECGGEGGPQEPIAFFARIHHVDAQALQADLERVAGGEAEACTDGCHNDDHHERATSAPAQRPHAVAAPAPSATHAHAAAGADAAGFARFFIASLLFALTFGATLGLLLLATITLPWSFLCGVPVAAAKTAHAYAQVFGFATLFIMGVAYHTMPRFKSTTLAAPRLTAASFWLQTGGVLLVGIGLLIGPPVSGPAWLLGTLLLLAAALAFGWTAHRTLAATAPLPEGFEPYLRAGCAWLVVAAGLAVATAMGLGAALQPAVWAAALWGFIGSWIFGMSLRVLPVFMGLPPARPRPRVFACYQLAVLLWVANAFIETWTLVPLLRGVAGAALGMSAAVFVLRLGIFGPREDPGGAVDRGYEKFIVPGYAWLMVAVVFEPGWSAGAALAGTPVPSLLADLGRHAFTLGFLAQLIIGVATRIVPVFTGSRLWSPRWREATYYLLNAAMAARALQGVVELANAGEVWPYIALSGPLGLAAFIAFTANVMMTMRTHPRPPAAVVGRKGALTADALMADVLAIPGAVEALANGGLRRLHNPATRAGLAHTVTLRQACRMHGIAVEPLVAALAALPGAADVTHQEHTTPPAAPEAAARRAAAGGE